MRIKKLFDSCFILSFLGENSSSFVQLTLILISCVKQLIIRIMKNIPFLIKVTSLVLLIVLKVLSQNALNAATFVVSSNANTGTNTLRQAITDANAAAGADIINFNFAVTTTIALTSCLPQIISPVTINGYSNPGAGAGNLRIEVTASGCPGVFDFGVGSDGSTIRGIVISGGSIGIRVQNSSNHIIRGNYIGTNIAGSAMAGSRVQDGINLSFSNNTIIGGTGGQIDRNIISGGTQDGIRVVASTGVSIINNYIGTDVTGNLDLGNNGNGIDGYNNGATGSNNMQIGGASLNERNVISANNSNGIYLNFCQSPVVKGNIIGMGLNGTTMLGNSASGIDIENTGAAATKAQIGGATASERNYSSCNGAFGIVVRSAPSTVIQGNWIGVDMSTGNLDYGNYDAAITVTATADVQCLNNICSGSGNPGFGSDGISIWNTSPRPIIKGNIIGLGVDGTTSLQNYGHGIECLTCDDGIIGGTLVSERNVVASSYYLGIQCVNSPRVSIINNYVGTDVSGTLDRGGTQAGINIGGSSNDVIIGGSTAARNIIAYNNASAGITLESSVQRVRMTFNSIFCNQGPGIDLAGASNEAVPAPVVSSSTTNSLNGTGVNGNVIHIYRNVRADGGVKCNCEGEIYIGSTTVSGGTWSFTHSLGLSVAAAGAVSATQTTPSGSTSEFSTCSSPVLPIELISFSVVKNTDHTVSIYWSTSSEKNNSHFEVQRSSDGVNFQTIHTIQVDGNSDDIKLYSVIDEKPTEGVNYYRLLQVDYDGKFYVGTIKDIMMDGEWYLIPEKNGFTFVAQGSEAKETLYTVYSLNGIIVAHGRITNDKNRITLNLPVAVYIAYVQNREEFKSYKIFIEE